MAEVLKPQKHLSKIRPPKLATALKTRNIFFDV
jgi:hypothetical protein